MQKGGGGHHPRHVERGGLPMRPSLRRQRPRQLKEGREWVRQRSTWRREGRLRLPWRRGSRGLGALSFFYFLFLSLLSCPGALFSFPFVGRSWGEGGQGALREAERGDDRRAKDRTREDNRVCACLYVFSPVSVSQREGSGSLVVSLASSSVSSARFASALVLVVFFRVM